MLKSAYAYSLKILGAYKNEMLLGIIRVVGDGYSIVVIQDVLVFPEYQRKGIGAALVSRILELYQAVYQKSLLTDDTEKPSVLPVGRVQIGHRHRMQSIF